jgi:hypothetical protein
MSSYYYFAASLPYLRAGEDPPLTLDAFRRLCRQHLTPPDAAAAVALLAEETGSAHPAARAWNERLTQFRNAVARQRAQRTRRDVEPFLKPQRECSTAIEKAVASAFSAPTPLEREKALDRTLWALAEETAGLTPFTVAAVLMYGVKLRLACRWAAMDAIRGEAVAQAIVSAPPTRATAR